MTVEESSSLFSITDRIQKIQTRMYIERLSGVSVLEKKQFLAVCREQEASGQPIDIRDVFAEEGSGCPEISWEDFGNWHDAPMYMSERRKVKVS